MVFYREDSGLAGIMGFLEEGGEESTRGLSRLLSSAATSSVTLTESRGDALRTRRVRDTLR